MWSSTKWPSWSTRCVRVCERPHRALCSKCPRPQTAPNREGPKLRKCVLIAASPPYRLTLTPFCRPRTDGRSCALFVVAVCTQNGNVVAALGTPPDNHLFELKCRVANGQPNCAIPDTPRKRWGGQYSCSKVRDKYPLVLREMCACCVLWAGACGAGVRGRRRTHVHARVRMACIYARMACVHAYATQQQQRSACRRCVPSARACPVAHGTPFGAPRHSSARAGVAEQHAAPS